MVDVVVVAVVLLAGAGFADSFSGEDDVGVVVAVVVGGRRKGRAPEGEAWLLEGTRSTSTPAIRRNVYGEEAQGVSVG
jgi:hypothetical protein